MTLTSRLLDGWCGGECGGQGSLQEDKEIPAVLYVEDLEHYTCP